MERITGEEEDPNPNPNHAAGKRVGLLEAEREEEMVKSCWCCCLGREATEAGIRRKGRVVKEAAIRD